MRPDISRPPPARPARPGQLCHHHHRDVYRYLHGCPGWGYRFVRWTGLYQGTVTSTCKVSLAPLTEKFKELDGDVQLARCIRTGFDLEALVPRQRFRQLRCSQYK